MHAHPIEITWFASGIILFIISITNIRDAIGIQASLDTQGINGRYRLVAGMHARSEYFKLSIACISLLCALVALYTAPPPPSYLELPQSLIGVLGFNFVNGLLIIHSLLDRKTKSDVALYATDAAISRQEEQTLKNVEREAENTRRETVVAEREQQLGETHNGTSNG